MFFFEFMVLTELNLSSLKIDCNKIAMTTQEVKTHLHIVFVYTETKKPTNMCVLMYILDISHYCLSYKSHTQKKTKKNISKSYKVRGIKASNSNHQRIHQAMWRFRWHRGQPKCSSSWPAIGDLVPEVGPGVLMVCFACNWRHITLQGYIYISTYVNILYCIKMWQYMYNTRTWYPW